MNITLLLVLLNCFITTCCCFATYFLDSLAGFLKASTVALVFFSSWRRALRWCLNHKQVHKKIKKFNKNEQKVLKVFSISLKETRGEPKEWGYNRGKEETDEPRCMLIHTQNHINNRRNHIYIHKSKSNIQ